MAISFWLAIYLLARSQSNALTFRAITALLALAFYFNTAYTEFTNPSLNTEQIRSIAVLIALVATHDLTVYLLPADLRKSRYWLARLIVLISVALVILHFYLPPASDCNPVDHCPVGSISLWLVIDLFKILVFVAILDNLWIITRRDGSFQNRPLLQAMLLGSCTIETKNFSPTFRALEDYDVTKLYVEKEALEARGLSEADLVVPVQVVSTERMAEIMDEQDVVLSF